MLVFHEQDNLVTVTYRDRVDGKNPFQAFADGVGGLFAAYRFDFLLDLRQARGPLDFLTNPSLSRRWADLAHGRDVGRRTAIVTGDSHVRSQIEEYRRS